MDFRLLGFEGILGHDNGNRATSQIQTFLSAESNPMRIGSGLLKQETPLVPAEEYECKICNLTKTDDLSTQSANTMPMHQATPLLTSNSLASTEANRQDYMTKHGSFFDREYGYGTLNASMHGVFTGDKGYFTPSQMIELQHQALIYKYITSNMHVPSNLLIPLKKSIYPYGLTRSPARPLAYNSLGWGSFHLDYTGNIDPEPGRCRRTDGKKWRCSRDVVAHQKYCERHLNRGRSRSRKPVEGQTGNAGTWTTHSMSASMNTIGGVANSLAIARKNQFKNLQSGAAKPSPDTLVNRMHDQQGLSALASATNLKSNNSTFTITKQSVELRESSLPDFGHVASSSLVNPSHKSYYTNSKEHGLFLDITGQETKDELKPDWTQLSMSYHMGTSEFSSSSSFPAKEKLDLSSLRLSHEFDRIQMGLGVNNDISDQNKKQANWIPASWGNSMGGPLGEVLNYTANNVGSCMDSSIRTPLSEGYNGSTEL